MPERREGQPDADALRARLASKSTTLADEVPGWFAGFRVGSGDYVIELFVPEAPSTPGAKPPLQHLRLRPRREGFAVVVAAVVNPVEKHAELRSFEHALLVQEVRFDKRLEITPPEWEQLLRKLELLLDMANIEPARVGPPPDLLQDSRRKKSGERISTRALVAFLVILLLAAGVTVLVVKKLMLRS